MNEKIIINNKDFAAYLLSLATICLEHGTDNCNITIDDKIKCYIEFKEV